MCTPKMDAVWNFQNLNRTKSKKRFFKISSQTGKIIHFFVNLFEYFERSLLELLCTIKHSAFEELFIIGSLPKEKCHAHIMNILSLNTKSIKIM
jgi:hypothetical protein